MKEENGMEEGHVSSDSYSQSYVLANRATKNFLFISMLYEYLETLQYVD